MKKISILILMLIIILSLTFSGQAASDRKDLVIVTGSSAGVYYLWGAAISKIINDNVPNTFCTVEATGGQFENPILVSKGDADIGIINVNTAWEGWRGIGEWTQGKKLTSQRVIALIYPSFLTVITLEDSDINSVQDFTDKNISLGPPMGTTDGVGMKIFDILDIEPKNVFRTSWGEVPGTVRDGLVDAYFSVGGQPWPPNVDLETTHKIKFIEFTKEDINALQNKYPYWSTTLLPKSTYKSLTKDYNALAWWNLLVVDESMSDDLVSKLLQALYSHKDIIETTHPGTAKYFSMDTISKSSIVLHKAAVKFYQENGINIPEELIPPEGK